MYIDKKSKGEETMQNEVKPVSFKITTSAADKRRKLELLYTSSQIRARLIADTYAKATFSYPEAAADIAKLFAAELHNQKLIRDCLK